MMIQNDVTVCGALYWVLFCSQVKIPSFASQTFLNVVFCLKMPYPNQIESHTPSSVNFPTCGSLLLTSMQFPIALAVFGYESVKLYREEEKRKSTGNTETICEATIHWTAGHIAFCALCGLLGGCVGGLLGSGGGFILGPLLLEIGVLPQVCTFIYVSVMLNSSVTNSTTMDINLVLMRPPIFFK